MGKELHLEDAIPLLATTGHRGAGQRRERRGDGEEEGEEDQGEAEEGGRAQRRLPPSLPISISRSRSMSRFISTPSPAPSPPPRWPRRHPIISGAYDDSGYSRRRGARHQRCAAAAGEAVSVDGVAAHPAGHTPTAPAGDAGDAGDGNGQGGRWRRSRVFQLVLRCTRLCSDLCAAALCGRS